MIFDQDKSVSTQSVRFGAQVLKLTLCWSLVWLFSACSTGAIVQNTPDHSLNLIRFAIAKVAPQGVRLSSSNQREFFSNYFAPGAEDQPAPKRERAYAHFLILGDRRPYKTEVFVIHERLTAGSFQKTGQDKALARQLAGELRDVLAKSREDRNFIDDFRAF